MIATSTLTTEQPGMRVMRQWPKQTEINVGDTERWASLIGGGLLGAYGLSQGTLGGLALAALGGSLIYRGVTGHCSMYATLGLNTAERHGPATSVPAGRGVKLVKTITIQRPPEAIYHFWRNLENLPRFMHHLSSVKNLGHRRSHWIVAGPLGVQMEWDAEIHNERPDELIAWRSLEGSEVATAGSVHFRPTANGGGTEIQVELKYDPPAGKFGDALAALFGKDPEQMLHEDLQRLKQLMESGKMPNAPSQLSTVQS